MEELNDFWKLKDRRTCAYSGKVRCVLHEDILNRGTTYSGGDGLSPRPSVVHLYSHRRLADTAGPRGGPPICRSDWR